MEQAFTITQSQPAGVQGDAEFNTLYKDYAGKLLGYILALVKNRETAEDCLVKIFTDIYRQGQSGTNPHYSNTWCWLMTLAREQITAFQGASQEYPKQNIKSGLPDDGFLKKMSAEQQWVFCGAYYHHKSVAELATELNMPDAIVRLTLKEAFTIIREVR